MAAELPEEILQAVSKLRTLSMKASKAAKKADGPELAAMHRAFAGDHFAGHNPRLGAHQSIGREGPQPIITRLPYVTCAE